MPAPATLALALFLLLALTAPSAAADNRMPNLVVLFTDDHGTLDANCFGSDDLITPNIDRIAAGGVMFTQAYADKVCCPSRASLLTGRWPQRVGVDHWTRGDRKETDGAIANLRIEEITIAEVLRDAGYKTGLFGKWHLGAKVGHGPTDQGYDEFFGHLGGFIDNYQHYFLHGKGFHDLYDGDEEIFREGEYFPDMMIGRALSFIEENRDVPFYAHIAFNLPHYPEQATEKWAEAYADLPMPRQSYARVISTVDDYVGQVLDKLEAEGVLEDTIVIFMGDNGHSAEDKGPIDIDDHSSGFPRGHYYSAHGGGGNTGPWIGHKGDLLEGGIRVPAILSYPGVVPQNESRDQVITVMDWFPTVLELAGIDKPEEIEFDGHSVLPLIQDPSAETAHPFLHFAWPNAWAVRRGDWKLIAKIRKNGQPPILSLHSLSGPRPEVDDHAADRPDIVAELQALHEAWEADVLQ